MSASLAIIELERQAAAQDTGFTEGEMYYVKAIAENWAIDLNEMPKVMRALHSKMCHAAATQDTGRLDIRECERIWNRAVDAEKREPDDFDYTISDDTDPPRDPLFRRIVKRAMDAARAAGGE